MPMMGNFYDSLDLQADGTVRAGGPLLWSRMPGVKQVQVFAAISQAGTYGCGSAVCVRPKNQDGTESNKDGTWWCEVHAEDNGQFQANQHALAAGVVVFPVPAGQNPSPWAARPMLT